MTTTTPAKVPVVLATTDDWEHWYLYIQDIARAMRLSQHVSNLAGDEPGLSPMPTPPTVQTVLAQQQAQSAQALAAAQSALQGQQAVPTEQPPPAPTALTADQRELLRELREDYKLTIHLWQKEQSAYESLNRLIMDTTSKETHLYVGKCLTIHSKLKTLKSVYAPTGFARMLEVQSQLDALAKTPRNRDIDAWIAKWEYVYQQAIDADVPSVRGQQLQLAFLAAVRHLEPTFVDTKRMAIVNGEIPPLRELLQQFRDLRRTATKTNNYSHGAFSTFQGNSDQQDDDDADQPGHL